MKKYLLVLALSFAPFITNAFTVSPVSPAPDDFIEISGHVQDGGHIYDLWINDAYIGHTTGEQLEKSQTLYGEDIFQLILGVRPEIGDEAVIIEMTWSAFEDGCGWYTANINDCLTASNAFDPGLTYASDVSLTISGGEEGYVYAWEKGEQFQAAVGNLNGNVGDIASEALPEVMTILGALIGLGVVIHYAGKWIAGDYYGGSILGSISNYRMGKDDDDEGSPYTNYKDHAPYRVDKTLF